MVSRVFVRTVLVAIVAVMVYLLDFTWSIQSRSISNRVVLTIFESAVLLAALSLLIESFRSFGTITINRNSPWFVFSGLSMVTEGSSREEGSIVYTRNCALFWARSFMLAVSLLVVAGAVTLLYQGAVNLVLFLWNPYTPNILWGEVASVVKIGVFAVILFGLIFWGFISLEKKLPNKMMFVKSFVVGLYVCVIGGAGFGALMFFSERGAHTASIYEWILTGIFTLIGGAFFFVVILVIGWGLYQLVGMASTKFPVLGNVWNTICPVQKINFVK